MIFLKVFEIFSLPLGRSDLNQHDVAVVCQAVPVQVEILPLGSHTGEIVMDESLCKKIIRFDITLEQTQWEWIVSENEIVQTPIIHSW